MEGFERTSQHAHWCHECNAEVQVAHVPSGSEEDDTMICSICGGGFIETLETAHVHPDVHISSIRHQHTQTQIGRTNSNGWVLASRNVDVNDTASSFQEVHISTNSPSSRLPSNGFVPLGTMPDSTSLRLSDDVLIHGANPNTVGSGSDGVFGMEPDTHASIHDIPEPEFSQLSIEEIHNILDQHLEEFGSHGDETESDAEVGLLELSDWDSFEEDDEVDWEEVEFNEVHFNESVDAQDQENVEGDDGSQGHQTRTRNILPRELVLSRLQAIRRNLESYNAEIALDGGFESDSYVSNPGDYVDAQGFEELLQQLIDTDTSWHGPPPAAKSVIDALPFVHIQQEHINDGSAICAICKDVVVLDEPVKQLPCLHLYHSTCILPWLGTRNSCPVCRYELPTDDPDYEDLKKGRNIAQEAVHMNTSSSAAAASEETSGDVSSTEGNTNGEHSSRSESMEVRSGVGLHLEESLVEESFENGRNVKEKVSFVETMAGPLFSVVGLVVVSCLGNLLLGNYSQKQPSSVHVEMQARRLREVPNGKPWWVRLFGG